MANHFQPKTLFIFWEGSALSEGKNNITLLTKAPAITRIPGDLKRK